MSNSPEWGPRLSRRAKFTLGLIGAIALAIPAILLWGDLLRAPPPKIKPPAVQPATFAGAARERIFLSETESREAVRRGLVPRGTRSIIATGEKFDFGSWRWDQQGVPPGKLGIRVDLDRQLVSVFQGPDEIGTAVIVYGVKGKETPRGRLPILGKARDYHSITYDAPMPFSLWLRDDGVALHGSSVTMGKATNGCIGVPVEFAKKLFEIADEGDIVEVIG